MKSPKQKKSPNKYILLSGAGIQMGVTIYVGVYIGKKLDESYPNEKNWFTIAFTLFGVAVALVSLITQINKINK